MTRPLIAVTLALTLCAAGCPGLALLAGVVVLPGRWA